MTVNETMLERRAGLSEEVIQKRRKASTDPVRQRMMERFYEDRDWTAKELAAALGLGVNGLYYHLRILEDAELIVPSGGRPGDRGLEKTYALGSNQHVDWEVDEDMVMMFSAMLESAKHSISEAVYETIEAGETGDFASSPFIAVNAPSFTTTREEIVEFSRRVLGLVREFSDRAKEIKGELDDPSVLRRMKFTYALRDRRISDEPATDSP